ncbi:MAG: Hsp20/alpha crystallin family protein [Patescibacteria group bacterium]
MDKSKKTIWSKITRLSEEDLSKTSEKVEILPLEKKEKQLLVPKPEKKKIKKEELEEITEEWLPGSEVGQLSIDLYDAGDSLVIESTIAGVKPEDIDITVEPDLITIRGERKQEKKINRKNYFYQECFWGKFSRTLVLPVPVKPEKVTANIKNGILTVTLPKAEEGKKNVKVE